MNRGWITSEQGTQKERDNESGLDYFLARYYSRQHREGSQARIQKMLALSRMIRKAGMAMLTLVATLFCSLILMDKNS